jgi:hypothetical protein
MTHEQLETPRTCPLSVASDPTVCCGVLLLWDVTDHCRNHGTSFVALGRGREVSFLNPFSSQTIFHPLVLPALSASQDCSGARLAANPPERSKSTKHSFDALHSINSAGGGDDSERSSVVAAPSPHRPAAVVPRRWRRAATQSCEQRVPQGKHADRAGDLR